VKFFSYTDPDAQLAVDPKPSDCRPLLRELAEEDLDSLAQFGAQLRYAAGSRILAGGERNDTLLLVV
jgi:hypothetical protein